MATLADSKTSHENNALKALALDHLGTVTAHVRRLIADSDDGLDSLRGIVAKCELDALDRVADAYRAVLEHLESQQAAEADQVSVVSRSRISTSCAPADVSTSRPYRASVGSTTRTTCCRPSLLPAFSPRRPKVVP